MKFVLAALPLVFGAALTAYALLTGDRRELVVTHSVAWFWLGSGFILTGAILVVMIARASRLRAIRAAHQAGSDEQRENQARFLSRLDHELKNPLTAIRAGVSNLDSQSAVVVSIDAQVMRLSRLITDLRKLAELRSVELEFASVDLAQLAAEVRDAVIDSPDTSDREIGLGFPRAPRPLPTVRGDYDLLFLALYNLVANAVKYSAPGETIEVRGSEGDGWVTVEVADTGRGIPSDEQNTVWEELSRGREARDVSGSGLGLPFVKAIVERHGGTVQLQSRAREGTLVRVSLPLAP
ncbi:MAG: sensor histidine kinase [Microbacteriaceae bacterium]